ncbi:MAG TPA: DinB family protein [Vicinamibacterales bacterium]|nr:DinB family protein [Vicinamibacterales bacterium]
MTPEKRRRFLTPLVTLVAMSASLALVPAPARAQDVMSKESVAELKTSFLTDLEVMRGKYVGLAEAFPQDKYDWRPMEGVRSVAEVLMLAAMEGYSFIPTSFGGKPPDISKEEMGKLRSLNTKAQVIDHLNKGFAHAKAQLEAVDNATLTGKRTLFGQQRSAAAIALFVGGDLHEHLGQLIAYARMNKIVPPWSK